MLKDFLLKSILLLAMVVFPSVMHPQTSVTIGNLRYDLDSPESGKATVVGVAYRIQIEALVIPNEVTYRDETYTVTAIGTGAFEYFEYKEGIISVTFPDSLISIGPRAFYKCTSLTSLAFPETLTSIGYSAFSECTGLTSLAFPETLTSIGGGAFEHCSGLTSLAFPETLTSIGGSAFANCYHLTSLEFPETLTSIGYRAFSGCSRLTSLKFPESLTSIGTIAFHGCTGLTSVEFQESNFTIGDNAFSECSIDNLILPNSNFEIGPAAFSQSNIRNLTILSSTCVLIRPEWSITKLTCSEELYKKYSSALSSSFQSLFPATETIIEDGVIWSPDKDIIYSAYDIAGEFNVPSSVEEICNYAFAFCDELTSIHIPKTISSLGPSPLMGCRKLKSITVAEENPNYSSFNGALYNKDLTCFLNPPGGVESIVMSDNTNEIAELAFYGCGLESITIPENIEKIGKYAFNRCYNLKHIDYNAIACTEQYSTYNDFYDVKSVTIGDQVQIIPPELFSFCTSVESVIIPNSVTSIEERAFSYCRNLKSIVIPENMEFVKEGAFRYCDSLSSITLEVENCNWGERVFPDRVDSLAFGDKVEKLADMRILSEVNFKSLSIGNSIKEIPERFFKATLALETIRLGSGIESIGDLAFKNCVLLKEIEVLATTPPAGYAGCFSDKTYRTAKLFVPESSIDLYKGDTEPWFRFLDISGTSGIGSVTNDRSTPTEVARYDLNGMIVNKDYRGIVIVVYSDGTSRKYLSPGYR